MLHNLSKCSRDFLTSLKDMVLGFFTPYITGVQRVLSRQVTTVDGIVPAGAVAVSIHNHSDTIDAVVLGVDLPAGETYTVGVDRPDTLPSIPYVTNGAELNINIII